MCAKVYLTRGGVHVPAPQEFLEMYNLRLLLVASETTYTNEKLILSHSTMTISIMLGIFRERGSVSWEGGWVVPPSVLIMLS